MYSAFLRSLPAPRALTHGTHRPVQLVVSPLSPSLPLSLFFFCFFAQQLLNESALSAKYGEKAGDADIAKTQRKDLVKGVTRGDETTERLDSAYAMAQNSANAGEEILNNLHDQREKILSARCSAEAMEGDMDTSERKMSRMACEKCIQRWVLWVIAFMIIGGLLFFLYWKMEIEPEKRSNCQRDRDGNCVDGGGGGGGRESPSRRSRAGSGEVVVESKVGRRYYYEGGRYEHDDDAYARGGGGGGGGGDGGGGGGGGGGYRRLLSASSKLVTAAEDLDTRTYMRYKARGMTMTMF